MIEFHGWDDTFKYDNLSLLFSLKFNANEVSFFSVYDTQMSKMSGGFLALQAKKSEERAKVTRQYVIAIDENFCIYLLV